MKYTVKKVNKSSVVAGDTIVLGGILRTVCKSNIKFDKFMGISIFGDSSNFFDLAIISRAKVNK